MNCQKCGFKLWKDLVDEEYGWCLNHGTVYIGEMPAPEKPKYNLKPDVKSRIST